jgi:hypothetical protein
LGAGLASLVQGAKEVLEIRLRILEVVRPYLAKGDSEWLHGDTVWNIERGRV